MGKPRTPPQVPHALHAPFCPDCLHCRLQPLVQRFLRDQQPGKQTECVIFEIAQCCADLIASACADSGELEEALERTSQVLQIAAREAYAAFSLARANPQCRVN